MDVWTWSSRPVLSDEKPPPLRCSAHKLSAHHSSFEGTEVRFSRSLLNLNSMAPRTTWREGKFRPMTRTGDIPGGRQPLLREASPISYHPTPSAHFRGVPSYLIPDNVSIKWFL